MPLDYPRDGAARCGDIIIYSARRSPPLNPMRPSPALSAALLRPRAPSPRWTPPPPRSSTSSSSSSSPTSSSYASGPPPWGSARGTAGARRPAWSAALLRPRAPSPRWTPPPPRSSTSSSSSSAWQHLGVGLVEVLRREQRLDVVVVVVVVVIPTIVVCVLGPRAGRARRAGEASQSCNDVRT